MLDELVDAADHVVTSRAVGHGTTSDLRLSGEWERTRCGPDTC
jgi:hypothetical protein